MTLYLIRHAHAGNKHNWPGPDEERPLSARGRAEAKGIADQFADAGVKRVVSSPAVRCRETVEPLAKRLGLKVELNDALAEGAPVDLAMNLLHELADENSNVALCSHGDVIPAVVRALEAGGLSGDGRTDSAKAGAFILEADDGRISHSVYVPPPGNRDRED